ncbi:MAG: hypothetical protein NVS4B12_10710 [Ktedonobacteraceae bacterium]
MKDDVQDTHMREGLPPCPMSSQCLRFIEEMSGRVPQDGLTLEDRRETQLLEQLRVHVPACPTCTTTVIIANKTLTQQRRVLRAMLDEGEQKVPSTTAGTMVAIGREQRASISANTHSSETATVVPLPQGGIETPRPKRPRDTLYSALALTAVAAMLVASFGLLSYILPLRSSRNSTHSGALMNSPTLVMKAPEHTPRTTSTWSAVIMTYKIHANTVIANYDPSSGKYTTLTSSSYVDTLVDGVSHDGQKVLYSIYDGFKTSYYLYPQFTTEPLFTTPDKSRSAIWSTDDRTLFISTAKGIVSIDVQTHNVKMLFPTLTAVKLLNYREDGYLYFVKGYKGQAYDAEGTFHRINIVHGDTQRITSCEHGTNFWLSPGEVTVYYNCLDQDASVLYVVKSNGTNLQVFRSDASKVIGYVEDGSPLTLVNASGTYQVVQRDLKSSRDTVVLKDVAPGATMVMADDIAVAPFGHTLIAKGMYNSSGATTDERLWYGDLTAGKSQAFALPQGASTANAIGWDKLQV